MKIQISFILLTFIILLLHLHEACADTTISQQKDQNLIESICKRTPNYRLCTATVLTDRSAPAQDIAGLGLIVVEAVKKKTKEVLVIIGKLQQNSRNNPKLAAALQRCKKVYTAVVEGDVPEAEQAIRGLPEFAENGMADAAVEASICEGELRAVVSPSPLKSVNKAIMDLADVARAIIRNLL